MVSPPIVCGVLLLGPRYAASTAKLHLLHWFWGRPVAVLLSQNSRSVQQHNGIKINSMIRLVEERALVKFFGEDYEVYRRKVSTRIPLIP